jgi:predicted transcriptional regulator
MDNLLKYNDMKYNDIIKGSKFYLPINLNLGYLLKDTEIILLMNLIHYSELGKKVSIPSLAKFTARSESTIKRALNQLRTLKLVSEDGYEPCLEQIALVYDSVNTAKSVKDREAWCKAYIEAEGQIEPLKKGQSDTLGLGQNEPLKEGQNEPPKKGQFEPPYKEDVYKEDSYKENTNNEYINNEDLEYNTNNILKEKKPSKENKVNRNSLKEDFKILTEEVKENQNEPKSEIEGNDDSNRYQPIENKQLTPSENKEISKAFRTLEFCKPPIDTNTLNDCLDVLHEVSQSKRENYKDCFAKAHSRFKQLLEGYTKEERKPFTKALLDLSSILGEAFKNKEPRQK